MLLLNDRIGADWRVRVDGVQQPLLRCNYIMRGVYVTPGHHVVEFVFRPRLDTLYVSVSAIVIGIVLAGYLIVTRKHVPVTPAPAAPLPTPQAAPPKAAAPSTKVQKGNGKSKKG